MSVSAAMLWALAAAAGAAPLHPGRNEPELRGRKQQIYYLPGEAGSAARPAVLFLPGDRGWAGKAVEMGRTMAGWGYDVYGLDTNNYLTSFTGSTTLTEQQIMDDLLAVSNLVAPGRRVLLTGWSEGAGLAALAASAPQRDSKYSGVVVFGLADRNALAWRMKDNLSILLQSEPKEPMFSVKDRLGMVAPTPLAILRSTGDQYVGKAEADELYAAAREPKRFVEVAAQNHRFDGNDAGFYRELRGAFEWALAKSR